VRGLVYILFIKCLQASYESTESQIASKRLELQQLEVVIASVMSRIEDLRRPPEKKETTSSNTAASNKKKKLNKKTTATSKGRSTAGSRNVAATAGVEEAEATKASPSWQTGINGVVKQIVASTGVVAALAVDHRAVILFAVSMAGIFFAGDYASV
jgi:chromosome segregation ATPase